MVKLLMVGLGGFCGSVGRYLIHGCICGAGDRSLFPWATATVNILGCLLIGLLSGLALHRQIFSPEIRLFLIVGILGGFTTFSTFSCETMTLIHKSHYGWAALNAFGQLFLGLGAAFLGFALSKLGTLPAG